MEQQSVPETPQKERVRWIPIWAKLLIVVLALASSVAYGFYKVGAGISDPEMIAKEYVKDLAAGQYENAYDQLKVEDETWFGQRKFAQAMDAAFAQCTIGDIRANAGRKQKQENGFVTRRVKVSFTTDSGETREWQVDMVQDGKLLRFYDNWRIVPTEIMQENWEVAVPTGAKLTIDQIPISGDYLQRTQNYEGAAGATQDVYVLPQVFRGTYRAQVELENCVPWQGQVSTEETQNIIPEPETAFYNDISKRLETAQKTAFDAIFHGGSLEKLQKYADLYSMFYQKTKERCEGVDKTYENWRDIKVDGIAIDKFEVLDNRHIRVTYTVRETRIPKGGGKSTEQTEQVTVTMEYRQDAYLIALDEKLEN